jgi:hypothetical protein
MKGCKPLATALATLACGAAWADPGYYVALPYDRDGQFTVEARYWTVKPPDGEEENWPEVAVGYGINSCWTTVLLESFIGSHGEATRKSSLHWENTVLLTQGELPFDVALFSALIRLQDERGGHAYEYGTLWQTEFGPHQFNLNAIFEHVRRAGVWRPVNLKWQWQWRWHSRSWVQPGLQGFSETGPWHEWAPHHRQSHRAGPAVFATFPPGGATAVQLQAAFLWGKTYGRAGNMFTARLLLPF